MKLEKLSLAGFGSYRDPCALDLSFLTSCVIVGNNGAGKSTLFEAVLWGLFGKTTGTRKTEDVINWESDQAHVEVCFIADNGVRWQVRRTIKRSDGSHKVEASNDAGVSYKKISEVADQMTTALGGDAALLTSTMFARTNELGKFARASSEERRRLLLRAMPSLDCSPIHKSFSADHATSKETKAIAKADLDDKVALAATFKDRSEALVAAQKEADQAKSELDALRLGLSENVEELKSQARKAQLAANELAECRTLIAAKESERDRYITEQQETEQQVAVCQVALSEARTNAAAAHAVLTEANQASATATAAVESQQAVSRLSQLDDEEGQACWVCGALLTATQIVELRTLLQTLITSQQQARHYLSHHQNLAAQADQITTAAQTSLDEQTAKLQNLGHKLTLCEGELEALRMKEATHHSAAAPLADLETALLTAQGEGVSAEEVDVVEQRWGTLKEQVGKLKQQVEDAANAARGLPVAKAALSNAIEAEEVDGLLVKAFAKSGVPQILMSGVAGEITRAANRNLRELSDKFSIKLATHNDDEATGLSLLVKKRGGEWHDYHAFSAGEQARLDISLRWGMSEAVGIRCGLLMLDEGWGTLDQPGRDTLAALLHQLIQTKKVRQFFTITHIPAVADQFQQRIIVEGDRERSTATLQAV